MWTGCRASVRSAHTHPKPLQAIPMLSVCTFLFVLAAALGSLVAGESSPRLTPFVIDPPSNAGAAISTWHELLDVTLPWSTADSVRRGEAALAMLGQLEPGAIAAFDPVQLSWRSGAHWFSKGLLYALPREFDRPDSVVHVNGDAFLGALLQGVGTGSVSFGGVLPDFAARSTPLVISVEPSAFSDMFDARLFVELAKIAALPAFIVRQPVETRALAACQGAGATADSIAQWMLNVWSHDSIALARARQVHSESGIVCGEMLGQPLYPLRESGHILLHSPPALPQVPVDIVKQFRAQFSPQALSDMRQWLNGSWAAPVPESWPPVFFARSVLMGASVFDTSSGRWRILHCALNSTGGMLTGDMDARPLTLHHDPQSRKKVLHTSDWLDQMTGVLAPRVSSCVDVGSMPRQRTLSSPGGAARATAFAPTDAVMVLRSALKFSVYLAPLGRSSENLNPPAVGTIEESLTALMSAHWTDISAQEHLDMLQTLVLGEDVLRTHDATAVQQAMVINSIRWVDLLPALTTLELPRGRVVRSDQRGDSIFCIDVISRSKQELSACRGTDMHLSADLKRQWSAPVQTLSPERLQSLVMQSPNGLVGALLVIQPSFFPVQLSQVRIARQSALPLWLSALGVHTIGVVPVGTGLVGFAQRLDELRGGLGIPELPSGVEGLKQFERSFRAAAKEASSIASSGDVSGIVHRNQPLSAALSSVAALRRTVWTEAWGLLTAGSSVFNSLVDSFAQEEPVPPSRGARHDFSLTHSWNSMENTVGSRTTVAAMALAARAAVMLRASGKAVVSFLEIGCYHNANFLVIEEVTKDLIARVTGLSLDQVAQRVTIRRMGVDPEDGGNLRMTSDEFFADPRFRDLRFDVSFVDGLHEGQQALRDVENVLDRLLPGGAIVMHDLSPAAFTAESWPSPAFALPEPKRASWMVEIHNEVQTQRKMQPELFGWNGDTWRAAALLRTRTDIDLRIVPVDHGVGILMKRPNPAPLVLPAPVLPRTRTHGLDSAVEVVSGESRALRAHLLASARKQRVAWPMQPGMAEFRTLVANPCMSSLDDDLLSSNETFSPLSDHEVSVQLATGADSPLWNHERPLLAHPEVRCLRDWLGQSIDDLRFKRVILEGSSATESLMSWQTWNRHVMEWCPVLPLTDVFGWVLSGM
jgi:hypothetical protein